MKATFAAGCFWGVEELFRSIKGVRSTRVGYSGGNKVDPTYNDVCSGRTGHAEAIEINYIPEIISYEELLEIFWSNHNPTTLNSQGPDFGSQYRSAVFYHNEDQKNTAIKQKQKLDDSNRFSRPIVTEITEASIFYNAENYHQQYLSKQGLKSCSFN